MVNKTKKVKSTGKFGPRYGKKIREGVRKAEEKSKAKHKCPQCGKLSLKREAAGIWKCTKCKAEIAGGAYVPQTELGKTTARILSTKKEGK